jgi:hypothetical protein
LHDLTLFHVREQPGNRLTRSPDHLRDLLVRESNLQSSSIGVRVYGFSVLGAPFQKQFSRLLCG